MEALERIRAAGVSVELHDGRLAVRGTMTAEQRAWLQRHRATIVAELTPAPATSATSDAELTKGACWRCCHPVTWAGPLEGLVSAIAGPIHLRCPDDAP